jgi:hypothetical protein
MKFCLFGLTLFFFLVHPLESGLSQDKNSQPVKKSIPVSELKNKILANIDTINQNYKEKISELKTNTPKKRHRYVRPKPAEKKLIVTQVPADSAKLSHLAGPGTFVQLKDSISTEAPKLTAPKKPGFFKRLFKKLKRK